MKVENTTPTEANVPMNHFWSRRSRTLKCRAPAKSRKLSMPCIKASLKSMPLMKAVALAPTRKPRVPSKTRRSERTRAMAINPMAIGSFRKRWLK